MLSQRMHMRVRRGFFAGISLEGSISEFFGEIHYFWLFVYVLFLVTFFVLWNSRSFRHGIKKRS